MVQALAQMLMRQS